MSSRCSHTLLTKLVITVTAALINRAQLLNSIHFSYSVLLPLSAFNWPNLMKTYITAPALKPASSICFSNVSCTFALALRDHVVIIYYHVWIYEHTGGAHWPLSQLWCRADSESAAATPSCGTHRTRMYIMQVISLTDSVCDMENAGKTLTSQSPAKSRSPYPEGGKIMGF